MLSKYIGHGGACFTTKVFFSHYLLISPTALGSEDFLRKLVYPQQVIS